MRRPRIDAVAAWRHVALGGLAAGLAAAPHLDGGPPRHLIAAGLVGGLAVLAARPSEGSAAGAAAWLGLLAATSAALGLGVGAVRLAAIDGGALDLAVGERITATGFVTAVPRRSDGLVRVRVETPDGRLLVEAPEPVPDLPVGGAIRASGSIHDPDPWESSALARVGVRDVLVADRIGPLDGRRDGLVSILDGARSRAEGALGRGIDADRAALLRGFVLGEDDRIDPGTVDEFRRSGLSHLLAVSGQNVVLLALLAWPLLALLGVGLRTRLLVILGLIALYVPIAGGGASIQRAGVMGAAAVVATLAARPHSRWYSVVFAAAVTLAVNPRASGDVGWQLSFVALVGILLWARPLAIALRGPAPSQAPVRAALAQGAAVTVAATLATAPLIAHHFEVLSLASLPANLLALPAVAPVMWLGMLAGLAGQVPWLPVEPLTWLAGACAGYIAQIAGWLGSPGWAQAELELRGPLALAGVYVAVATALTLALRWRRRRTAAAPRGRWLRIAAPGAAVTAAALSILAPGAPGGGDSRDRPPGLRVSVFDVGQGDAILLEPRKGDPVLVDAGPAESDVAGALAERGVDRLAALVFTHPQADHVGGIPAVLAEVAVDRLLYARGDRGLTAEADAEGARTVSISAGTRLRSGSMRLEVVWPPELLLTASGADPNLLSLVLLVRWRGFEMLLAGDAEAEVAPVDPGPVDVLKVAHHGSADGGLDRLLDGTSPRLAVISVGAENPYGHPAPETLDELREHGVMVARTDAAGTVTIDVARDGWSVR